MQRGDGVLEAARTTGGLRNALGWAVFVAVALAFLNDGLRLGREFPTSYTWSELMISYQGGFVRRGLLGEVAFHLDRLIPARDVIVAAVVVAHCGLSGWLVTLTRRVDPMVGALFLLSPAGLLFPLYDDQAFGRKDVFIVAAFAASAILATRAPRGTALAGLAAIYLAAGLVVETAWLYVPLAVALAMVLQGENASPRWLALVWTGSWLLLGIGLLGSILANAPLHDPAVAHAREDAMVQAWRAFYPDAYVERDALQWIGMSPADGVAMALRGQGRRNTALGWALGFVLAQLPTVLLMLRSRPVASAPWMRPVIGVAFAAMSLSFLIGADWGRYIHLWTLHGFIFAALARRPSPGRATDDRSTALAAAALIALYASTWRLKHYVWDGNSALVPGALFRLVRSAPP